MGSRLDLSNAIRALAMDAVQQANSGHPGMPMGMADIAEVLWRSHLKHNPADPAWADRDRFVLSNGHGSMLLYALLHLTGYDLPMEQIRRFRQLHSKTPGHPEVGVTPGVETTTGPLGQGITNAVGMALAEKLLAALVQLGGGDQLQPAPAAPVDFHIILAPAVVGLVLPALLVEPLFLAGHVFVAGYFRQLIGV